MLRIPVTYDLVCEIKQDRNYASTRAYHAIITRNKKEVAIVSLNPVYIVKGADLLEWEKEEVITIVTRYKDDLEEEYRKVLKRW